MSTLPGFTSTLPGFNGVPPAPGANCPPPDPVEECFNGCHEKAKEKQEECKRITKEFVDAMKASGCRGTFCRTGPVGKTCRNKRSYRRGCRTYRRRTCGCRW